VAFAGASITAEEALNASGIPWRAYDYGGSLGRAVCQVDGEPATPPSGHFDRDNCLYSNGSYWSLRVARAGGGWTGSPRGVSSTVLSDGDAEGLAYGDGTQVLPSPAGVCPASAPAPAPAPPPPGGPGAPPSGSPGGGAATTPPNAGTNGARTAAPAEPTNAAGTRDGGSPSPDPTDPHLAPDLATPGAVALGSLAGSPRQPGPPRASAALTRGPGWPFGWLAAAALALALVIGLAIQMALPRLRR
jgi:hypothetical protein